MRTSPRFPRRAGFTLVELSIVLVVIGMLVGGVLGARELVRQSEVASVGVHLTKMRAAVNSFKLKYNALPGDMRNAYDYFGSACGANTPSLFNDQSGCNGNGNGAVEMIAASGNVLESYRFWQHLALAGLIDGTYAGVSNDGNSTVGDAPGVNTPVMKVPQLCLIALQGGVVVSPTTSMFWDNYPNSFDIGIAGPVSGGRCYGGFFSGPEAASFDKKYDEGNPGRGGVHSFPGIACTANAPASASDTAAYNLSDADQDCFFRVDMQ